MKKINIHVNLRRAVAKVTEHSLAIVNSTQLTTQLTTTLFYTYSLTRLACEIRYRLIIYKMVKHTFEKGDTLRFDISSRPMLQGTHYYIITMRTLHVRIITTAAQLNVLAIAKNILLLSRLLDYSIS